MNEDVDKKMEELLSLTDKDIEEAVSKLSLYEIEILLARLYEVSD